MNADEKLLRIKSLCEKDISFQKRLAEQFSPSQDTVKEILNIVNSKDNKDYSLKPVSINLLETYEFDENGRRI